MKISLKKWRFTSRDRARLLVVATAMCAPQFASAIHMSVYANRPSQWGTGSAIYLGHTVLASTPYNNLVAGGVYTVQCNHPAVMPMSGERTLSSSTLGVKTNQLTVTIPAQQPALRNISGWLQIPGNTVLSCNYRWTAFATEGGFTISVAGVSYQIGNGTTRDADTIDFQIYRPPREDADGGCTP